MSTQHPGAECYLTPNNIGGGREALAVWRRGRLGTVCARGACPAWSSGPSTSPLGGRQLRAMIAASSRFDVPSASSDFTNKSSETVGSPASILATLDWLERRV